MATKKAFGYGEMQANTETWLEPARSLALQPWPGCSCNMHHSFQTVLRNWIHFNFPVQGGVALLFPFIILNTKYMELKFQLDLKSYPCTGLHVMALAHRRALPSWNWTPNTAQSRRRKRSRRRIAIIAGAHNRLGLQEPSHTIMVFSVRLTWCDERVMYCRQHHPKISFLEPSQWFLHLFTRDTTSLFNQVDRPQIGLRPDAWWALLLREACVFIKYISGIDRKRDKHRKHGMSCQLLGTQEILHTPYALIREITNVLPRLDSLRIRNAIRHEHNAPTQARLITLRYRKMLGGSAEADAWRCFWRMLLQHSSQTPCSATEATCWWLWNWHVLVYSK